MNYMETLRLEQEEIRTGNKSEAALFNEAVFSQRFFQLNDSLL